MKRDVPARDQRNDDVDLGFVTSEVLATAEDLSCPSVSNMLEFMIDHWSMRGDQNASVSR